MAVAVFGCSGRFETMRETKPSERSLVCSVLEERINAPADIVWAILRDFGNLGQWAPFVTSCEMIGELKKGAQRLVRQKSGIPGSWRIERLDFIDDSEKVIVYSVIDGDTGTKNSSVTVCVRETVHEGRRMSLVEHCFLLPPPPGSSEEDALTFISFSSRLLLRHLASFAESMALEIALHQSFKM